MLWVKSLHIVFVSSWFAGLFYLPRILVNLAQESNVVSTNRLLLMARRLYRFTTILAFPAVLSGVSLWLFYGIGEGPGNGWLLGKLLIVALVVIYHFSCNMLLRKFEGGKNIHSHIWFRWFNEIPVLLMLSIVILVVVKPF